jgi:integrase
LSSGSASSGAYPAVSGDVVQQVEARPEHRRSALGCSSLLLYQGIEEELERCRDALSRRVIRLPEILSPEEVARLINAARLPFYRILLMTLYGTGARGAEVARLTVGDIESRRMVVRIHVGKGNRDRDVMLSQTLLDALRGYWRGLRRQADRVVVSRQPLAHRHPPDHYEGLVDGLSARR